MSKAVRLPSGAWVLVADGKKALLLVNRGDAEYPDLRIEQTVEAPANPPTGEQGSDRPGRTRTMLLSRRSAVGQTDWHRMSEARFAADVVERLFAHATPPALVLAAPPAFLAQLRKRLPKPAKANLLADFNRDLTHLTVHDIERTIALSSTARHA